jgi:hypothetical protein
MEHEDVHAMVYDIMSDAQRKTYEENLECDFSFAVPNLARFRVNAFVQSRGAAAAFRTVPSKVLSLEELNTPKVFAEMTNRPRGLILCTGPTGSGKSTTLAAMVDHVNANEYGHILTIEDPIEFMHESKKCLINQRELGPAHAVVPERAPQRAARRPGLHPDRRDARPRDDPARAHRGGDGAPRVRHAAHELGRQDDRPDHRRVSRRRKRRWSARCCPNRSCP